MSFERILSRIVAGETVAQSELLPYLRLEQHERRSEVNRLLADAFWRSGRDDYRQHARVSIDRAWLLGGFAADLLPLYTAIHGAFGDVAEIKSAYKRAGVMAAERGNVSLAIHYFNLWQYAHYEYSRLDRFEYDYEILDCVERFARPHRLFKRSKPRSPNGKLRLAYLVKGINELGSVMVKIMLLYARYHDRSRVEPIFFVPNPEREVMASDVGRENMRLFEQCGCQVVMAPNMNTPHESLLALARSIYDSKPDVLVTAAALAHFEHYYITALRPAPFIVGWVVGPPPQFAAPTLDWGIAWSTHPLIDCPVSCSLLNMELELPERDRIATHARQELDIPEHAVVAATAGRHVKFQDPEFWRAVIELLEAHPELYYLAMGVEEAQAPFVTPMLSPETRNRLRFLGWRGDEYLKNLCVADFYIDTHPSGGGTIVEDAAALGIPPILFEQDFMRFFDQVYWSPADELFDIRDMVVARGDYAALKRMASRMIEDVEFRNRVGAHCREHIHRTRGNPARAVQQFEETVTRVLKDAAHGTVTNDREAEIRELAGHKNVPVLVGRAARWLKRAMRYGERVLDRVA
jgi:hypothetical protein